MIEKEDKRKITGHFYFYMRLGSPTYEFSEISSFIIFLSFYLKSIS